MSKTVFTKTSNNQRRSRGREHGNQWNRNNNNHESNFTRGERNTENDNNSEGMKFQANTGYKHTRNNRNRGQNRGNFKNNNNEVHKRSHSSSSSHSSRSDVAGANTVDHHVPRHDNMFGPASSSLPKHAQNPIFVHEIMDRFNSIIPPSPASDQIGLQPSQESNSRNFYNHSSGDNTKTFDQISNNIVQGFRNNHGRNENNRTSHSFDNRFDSYQKRGGSHNQFNNVDSQTPFQSSGETKNSYTHQNREGYISSSDFDRRPTTSGMNNKSQFVSDVKRYPSSVDSIVKRHAVNEGHDKRGSQSVTKQFDDRKIQHLPKAVFDEKPKVFSTTVPQKPQKPVDSKKGFPTNVTPEEIDRRRNILQANGFNVRPPKENSSEWNMFNVNPAKQNSSETNNSSVQNSSKMSAKFFSQMDKFDTNKKDSGEDKKPVYKSGNNQNNRERFNAAHSFAGKTNNPAFDMSRQINDYNNFFYSQGRQVRSEVESPTSKVNAGQANSLSNIGRSTHPTGNNLEFTDGSFAGGTPLNICRPVCDSHERVPSRQEALNRIQDEYQLKQEEYLIKEREKEAKKREQYLARYKYVDQGHRMTDGYLDEAAGYDPEYRQFAEEEVRERQQEQLRRDALLHQERERKELERRKKQEEEKQKQWMNKHKHIDAGYKLGHGDNRGGGRGGGKRRGQSRGGNTNTARPASPPQVSISPELLLEGETPEQAMQRQEEQLIIHSILYNEINRKKVLKMLESEPDLLPPSLAPPEPKAQAAAVPQQEPGTGGAGGVPQLASPPVSVVKPIQGSAVDTATGKTAAPAQTDRRVRAMQEPIQGSSTTGKSREAEDLKKELLSQLEKIISKPANTPIAQEPVPSQKPTKTEIQKPATCVVKNPTTGPVLVMRPTEEALNLALARRLEVLDDMDKRGTSALYKPQAEQTPLYNNNRFERKPLAAVAKATGAIPKQKLSPVAEPASKLPSDPVSQATCPPTIPAETEPVIDHQAEMRAARLRMQQKYEESLKKLQEQPPVQQSESA